MRRRAILAATAAAFSAPLVAGCSRDDGGDGDGDGGDGDGNGGGGLYGMDEPDGAGAAAEPADSIDAEPGGRRSGEPAPGAGHGEQGQRDRVGVDAEVG